MGRRAVEKKIVFFYILAVIPLLIGQTEHPLFKDAILFIPQCHGQADMLLVIAKSTNAVFVPAIGSVAGMVMRKIVPGITVCAVVFAHGSPGALTKIGTPTLPIGLACEILSQATLLSIGGHGF